MSTRRSNHRTAATLVPALGAALLAVVLAAPAAGGARPTPAADKASVDAAHLTWTRSPAGAPGAGNLNAIATDGKRFVTAGLALDSSLVGFVPIWTSSDGLRWKQAKGPKSAFPANISIADVVHTGHRFLAFGYPRTGQDAVLAWTSKDGVRWTRYHAKGFPPSGPTGAPEADATVTNTGLLLRVLDVHDSSRLWSMDNGRWHVLGDLPDVGQTTVYRALPGRRGFIAVGRSNDAAAAWTSKTGARWGSAPILGMAPGDGSIVADAIAGKTGFVAVGNAAGSGHPTARVWVSADGRRWQPVSGNVADLAGRTDNGAVMDLVTTDGRSLIATGADGQHVAIWTSKDGRSWRLAPETTESLVQTGTTSLPTGVAAVRGHVVIVFRELQFNSTSNDYDIRGLGILSGSTSR